MLEIVIIIIAAAVLIIAAVLILVMLLKDRNKNNMTGSGGVDLNHDLLELQRKLNAQSGLHSGTLVVQTNRVKISVYNCRNNTETVAYVINELVFLRPNKRSLSLFHYRRSNGFRQAFQDNKQIQCALCGGPQLL